MIYVIVLVVAVCNTLEMIVRDEVPVLINGKKSFDAVFIQFWLNKTSISTKSDLECLHSR